MNIHHYHPETRQFIGSGVADRDPLDDSAYLMPAWSTATPPPIEQTGKTRHFNDGAWVYRDIPEPVVVPVPSFQDMKAKKLAEFRGNRLALLDVISGMGWAALVENDTATATALATFRRGLLDLPQHSTVTAATDIADLSMAMAVRYKQLTDALPAAVKANFKALV